MKLTQFLPVLFLTLAPVDARQDPAVCGTHADRTRQEIYLSRQAARQRSRSSGVRLNSGPNGELPQRTAAHDIGNIAVLEDLDGVVARRNPFNLSNKTVLFTPVQPNAARYRFDTTSGGYEPALASAGTLVNGLLDDDSREIALPFAFPFFGNSYRTAFINSDGNLTFGAADSTSAARSLGRVTTGAPRIAGLFDDLDPTASRDGVRVLAENWRVVVSWSGVPEYSDFNNGLQQSFQIRIYPDGRIEVAWSSITATEAVVGIAPGSLKGATSVVSFNGGGTAEYPAAIAERFTAEEGIDIMLAAQKFFETHDDAYDYLVVFNNMGVMPGDNALAYEVTVRNDRTGYGDPVSDNGVSFGSPKRLQAFLNMGPLTQYPTDPNRPVPGRGQISGDTPLTIIGHETGHLFLAFASVRDEANPRAMPMLGRDGAHWAFTFNSEASLLEGNRIRDNGAGTSPRFTTVATVEGYSPLDQYLMGFRPADEVPPTFYVQGSLITSTSRTPQVGVGLNGERRDVFIQSLIDAEGRRTPDHTVSQRRFNFAFVLVVPQGTEPTAAQLQQIETYRREFEPYFGRVSGNRAVADTSLHRSLSLSVYPAAGVLLGAPAKATVAVAAPVASPLTVLLRTQTGAATVPASVTIPVGASKAEFTVTGARVGVEELTAEPGDSAYQVAAARIQVLNAASDVRLQIVSGDKQAATPGSVLPQAIVLRVTDANNLPYAGVRVAATVTAGGSLDNPTAVSDETGRVQFRWTPSAANVNELRAAIESAPPASAITVSALGRPSFAAGAVVNAASFAPGLTPGALATIFGANLAAGGTAQASLPLPQQLLGVQVTVGGAPVSLVYVSDGQINFWVPPGIPAGTADLVVTNRLGSSNAQRVTVSTLGPGIFFDVPSGQGAILIAGTAQTTAQRPAAPGETLEIYATGLGPVSTVSGLQATVNTTQVFVGALPAPVSFSGLAPGFVGLYQVNAQVPGGTPSGTQPLALMVNGQRSNSVSVQIR